MEKIDAIFGLRTDVDRREEGGGGVVTNSPFLSFRKEINLVTGKKEKFLSEKRSIGSNFITFVSKMEENLFKT